MIGQPRTKLSTTRQRVKWLLENIEVWKDYKPKLVKSKILFNQVFRAMQKAGLYSKTSYPMDCYSGVIQAVELARDSIKETKA